MRILMLLFTIQNGNTDDNMVVKFMLFSSLSLDLKVALSAKVNFNRIGSCNTCRKAQNCKKETEILSNDVIS